MNIFESYTRILPQTNKIVKTFNNANNFFEKVSLVGLLVIKFFQNLLNYFIQMPNKFFKKELSFKANLKKSIQENKSFIIKLSLVALSTYLFFSNFKRKPNLDINNEPFFIEGMSADTDKVSDSKVLVEDICLNEPFFIEDMAADTDKVSASKVTVEDICLNEILLPLNISVIEYENLVLLKNLAEFLLAKLSYQSKNLKLIESFCKVALESNNLSKILNLKDSFEDIKEFLIQALAKEQFEVIKSLKVEYQNKYQNNFDLNLFKKAIVKSKLKDKPKKRNILENDNFLFNMGTYFCDHNFQPQKVLNIHSKIGNLKYKDRLFKDELILRLAKSIYKHNFTESLNLEELIEDEKVKKILRSIQKK
jgi:hypothetical protein